MHKLEAWQVSSHFRCKITAQQGHEKTPLRQSGDDFLIARGQVHGLAERLRQVYARLPVHFYLIAVGIFKIDAHRIPVAHGADDRHVALQKRADKLFEIG
jgi:hypothetical protein